MSHGLSHTGLFVDSLEQANQFTLKHAVRAYQREVLETGTFSVTSPATGVSVTPALCHVANNGDPAHGNIGIAYRLPGNAGIWLLASSTRDGFPLTEAFMASEGVSLWSLGDGYCEENRAWRARLCALEQNEDCAHLAPVGCSRPQVLMGHPNFAHHLWNELAALFLYARECRGIEGSLSLDAIYEPLLPLANLAPGAGLRVRRIERFTQLTGFQGQMVTRLGSTRIPAALREEVIREVAGRRDAEVTDPCAARVQGSSPVVWVSLRHDARTADNQEHFLEVLITTIATRYPAAAFLLDGFSYPADFDHPIYRQAAADGRRGILRRFIFRPRGFLAGAMQSRERAITAGITRFQRRLEARLSNPVISVSGMNLVDSIYLAHFADYYVCHAGTLQHKVAWIYNIPGTVHSNTAGVGPGNGEWLASQLEDGVQPAMVPVQHIQDLDTIRTANQVARNRDYHIRDIDTVVAGIIADMEARIHPAANGFTP